MISIVAAVSVSFLSSTSMGDEDLLGRTLKALILDGQNNHGNWPQTSQMMKTYLEQTGLFRVDIATTKPKGIDPEYSPKFAEYDVLVSNYNGAPWPKETQASFVEYMSKGGGLVVVHAADNAFPKWKAFNEMIGLGGWGGRTEASGPYIYLDDDGKVVRDESPGRGGNHGRQHEFVIKVRKNDHPVTKGMPEEWLHQKDELYDYLRGPGKNMEILATAFASKEHGGSGRHEPMIMALSYGSGRVLHTPMGHGNYSQECVGFIVTIQRGAEWAATGRVTQKIPADFPTREKGTKRPFALKGE